MGRPKKFFPEGLVSAGDNETVKCTLCKKVLKCHMGNIKRHYEHVHKKSFTALDVDTTPSSSKIRKNIQTAPLKMSKEEFLKCIGQTVSEMHMPFRYFDNEKVFQQLLQPWTTAYGIKFNSKSIATHINQITNLLRDNITLIVCKKFLCLKLDIASRMERSIMGVNIQFIQDFEVIVYTIGMVELHERHCATYLKQQVLDILKKFNIDLNQIYSITTDNGANVIKTSKLLQEYVENDIADDECFENQIFDTVSDQMSESLCVVHCAAHTLQLAAWDVIKKISINIHQCREAVKMIRKKMRELQLSPIPVLDNTTRWSSTYEMIKTLLIIEETVKNNSLFKISVDWEFAKNFEKCFKPVAEATTMMQSKQLVMGDFYREWLVCETEVEELSNCNEIANYLLEALYNRKIKLMNNNAFLAALYLDARFCFRGSSYLTDEQKRAAILHLLMIFNKLKSIGELNDYIPNHEKDVTNINSFEGRYEKLEKKAAANNFRHNDFHSVQESLEQLQYEEKLPFHTNILSFWKAKSYNNCAITKIAEVALAVPATQVSVERAFSALPIVMTKNRRNLSAENLENILLLKLNPSIVENISLE